MNAEARAIRSARAFTSRTATAPLSFLLVVAVLLSAACASTPPDRIAYTSIDSAVTAVQLGMRGFNDLYQAGKFTKEDRAKVLDAYVKFQSVATAAATLAEKATNETEKATALDLISTAAAEVLRVVAAFTKPQKVSRWDSSSDYFFSDGGLTWC